MWFFIKCHFLGLFFRFFFPHCLFFYSHLPFKSWYYFFRFKLLIRVLLFAIILFIDAIVPSNLKFRAFLFNLIFFTQKIPSFQFPSLPSPNFSQPQFPSLVYILTLKPEPPPIHPSTHPPPPLRVKIIPSKWLNTFL
jgi:hypothetical protein